MKTEIYPSTSKGKIKFYAAVIILLVAYLVLDSNWFQQLNKPDFNNLTTEQMRANIQSESTNTIIYSIVVLPFYCAISFLTFRFGRRIQASQQFPPPNSEIPFSVKIKRGKAAIRQAYMVYAGSALIIVNGIIGVVLSIYSASHVKQLLDAIK